MKKSLLLFLLSSILFTATLQADKKPTDTLKSMLKKVQKSIKGVTPKEFKTLMDSDDDFVQLDVRENNQYGHGEIFTYEKVKLTRGYLEYKIENLIINKNTKIVIVCCSGKRAILAAQTLKNLGYKDVSYLKTGVYGWIHSGYPLDTVFGELYLKPTK